MSHLGFRKSLRGRRRGSVLTTLLVLGGVTLATVVGVVWYWNQGESEESGPLLVEVQRGPFSHDVVAPGEVDNSNNVPIVCKVRTSGNQGVSIQKLYVEDGDEVSQGQLLLVFNSTDLERDRDAQEIVLRNAHTAVVEAKAVYDAAIVSKKEYEDGTYVQEVQTIESEIFVAQENLRRAEQYALYSERLAAKGYVTQLQLQGDRFAVEKAKKELNVAQKKLFVLQNYTKKKMLVQFDSDIQAAKAKWENAQKNMQAEKEKLQEINGQIDFCTVRAPRAGRLYFANEFDRRGDAEFVVEEKATVREEQTIFRMPISEELQVKCTISEGEISLVKRGLQVRLTFDALKDQRVDGEVISVARQPQPSSRWTSNVKNYPTSIRVIDPPEEVRPGMTASVKIRVADIPEAVRVPVQAVHQHGTDYYCFVRRGDSWEARPVEVGPNNEKHVVIKEGVRPGEMVAMNPRKFIKEVDLPPLDPAQQAPERKQEEEEEEPSPADDDSGRQRPSPDQVVQFMLSRADKNGDGKISKAETPDRMRDSFDASDRNQDGFLDKSELTQMIRKRMSGRDSSRGGPAGRPPGGGPR